MSDFQRCENCGEYDWKSKHKCAPEWEAILVDYHDEDVPRKAFGHTIESAVESFCERGFSDWDHPEEMEIWAREPGAVEWQKFEVTVQPVPGFTVSEISGIKAP